jgi:hypothetical protein
LISESIIPCSIKANEVFLFLLMGNQGERLPVFLANHYRK